MLGQVINLLMVRWINGYNYMKGSLVQVSKLWWLDDGPVHVERKQAQSEMLNDEHEWMLTENRVFKIHGISMETKAVHFLKYGYSK